MIECNAGCCSNAMHAACHHLCRSRLPTCESDELSAILAPLLCCLPICMHLLWSSLAGKLWGHEIFGVEPDMMTLAKPLAGGLPIGAVLLKQHVADAMQPGAVQCCWSSRELRLSGQAKHRVLKRRAGEALLPGVAKCGQSGRKLRLSGHA